MTAYELLQKTVADAQSKYDTDRKSLDGWRNDTNYLKYKADPQLAVQQKAYIDAIEAKIRERAQNVADDKIAIDTAIDQLTKYENTSPTVSAQIADKKAQTDILSNKVIIIGASVILGLGIILGTIIYFVRKNKKQPTT